MATDLTTKIVRLHGNRLLPAGFSRQDVENLDISDRRWLGVSVADRFSAALSQVPLENAASATGKSERQLLRYAKGDEMPLSVLLGVSEITKIPAAWIIAGVPYLRGEAASRLGDGSRQGSVGFVTMPRFDTRASAGAGALVASDEVAEYVSVGRDWLRRNLPPWAPPNAVVGVLEGSGDSMEPTIRDGDLIMVVAGVEWRIVERGGIFVLTIDGERLLLKRLQVLMNGDLKVISDNRNYDPEVIPLDQLEHRVRILGQVFFTGGKPRSL